MVATISGEKFNDVFKDILHQILELSIPYSAFNDFASASDGSPRP